MNVRELAERTHTSTASIIRFCKKFQCAGFSDFKVKLRLYIDKAESLNETADLDESLIINFMQRTTEKIYQQKIAEVAKLLASKELIFLIGIGSSKVTAEYGALYFSSIFNMSVSIQNPLLNPVSYITRDLANKNLHHCPIRFRRNRNHYQLPHSFCKIRSYHRLDHKQFQMHDRRNVRYQYPLLHQYRKNQKCRYHFPSPSHFYHRKTC